MFTRPISRFVVRGATMLLAALFCSQVWGNGGMYSRDYAEERRTVEENETVIPARALPLIVSKGGENRTRIKIPKQFLAGVNSDAQSSFPLGAGQTIIAGLALALAGSCCFVALGRRIRHRRGAATAAMALLAACSMIGAATADMAAEEDLTGTASRAGIVAAGNQTIVLEISNQGEAIELVLGSDATWAK